MRSGFRRKFDRFTIGIENNFRKYKYRKYAKLRLKRMNGGYDCTHEYKDGVYMMKYNEIKTYKKERNE